MPILAEGEQMGEQNQFLAQLIMWGPIVLIVVLMYFEMIRPQRKKQKEEQRMRNSIRVGDEITTIGRHLRPCSQYQGGCPRHRNRRRPEQDDDQKVGVAELRDHP